MMSIWEDLDRAMEKELRKEEEEAKRLIEGYTDEVGARLKEEMERCHHNEDCIWGESEREER